MQSFRAFFMSFPMAIIVPLAYGLLYAIGLMLPVYATYLIAGVD